MTQRIYSLQALRFIAAAMVVLLHVQQGARSARGLTLEGGAISNMGSFGVDVFFVLSGYVICRTASGADAGEFFRNRVVRVVPIYWLMTLLFIPFAIVAGSFDPARGIASLLFYPGFGLPWLSVGWTLCFEMLFYGVIALILIRPRTFLPIALAVYALCVAARSYFGGPLQFFGNPIILEFLCGAALTRVATRSPFIGICALTVAVVSLAMITGRGIGGANNVYGLLAGETALARVIMMGIPAVLLVYGALNLEIRNGALAYLGDTSYALYLVHPHIVAIALLVLPAMSVAAFSVLITFVAIIAGVATHELIEKPLIASARRLLSRRTAEREGVLPVIA